MAMIEQNISGVKLEKLRRKAEKKTKFLKRMPKWIFFAGVLLTLFVNRYFFILMISGYKMNGSSIMGGIFMIIGGIMMSFCVAAAAMGIYLLAFWKKTYDTFNDNYKNKYVLLKMREVPGFSDLKYLPQKGISFDELSNVRLLPGRAKSFFESKDYFEGIYETIRFRACSVETYESNNSSLSVFSGQVIVFSSFHEFKISETAIQIFPGKESKKMKGLTFPERVETENEAFNEMFSVCAEDGHNAFYILTPQVMEDIMEFGRIINNNVYLAFSGSDMYVGCEQMRNPFDAIVDMSIEEQSRSIVMATEMIQKAREILIHIENRNGKENGARL